MFSLPLPLVSHDLRFFQSIDPTPSNYFSTGEKNRGTNNRVGGGGGGEASIAEISMSNVVPVVEICFASGHVAYRGCCWG